LPSLAVGCPKICSTPASVVPGFRAMGNSTLPCPSGSIWHLISNCALRSTCCQRNPPTVPPSISPLISHKTQSPWRPVPCKQSQLRDSLASPLCPIVPPVCFRTASRLVCSSTIRCPETRRAVIISLATVDLESSETAVPGGSHIAVAAAVFRLVFCADELHTSRQSSAKPNLPRMETDCSQARVRYSTKRRKRPLPALSFLRRKKSSAPRRHRPAGPLRPVLD